MTAWSLCGSCLLCGVATRLGSQICQPCQTDLPLLGRACQRCSRPLAIGSVCARCVKSPPPYTRCFSIFEYRYPVNVLVQRLKYKADLHLLRQLGKLMSETLPARIDALPQCLIAVPLHPLRLLYRGYNQAVEIARPISQALGIPITTRHCKRIRNTPAQASLSPKDRAKNVQAAFAVPCTPGYTHVAIVDDVVTTGQTVSEISKELLRAGVKRVDVWALCRTVAGSSDAS